MRNLKLTYKVFLGIVCVLLVTGILLSLKISYSILPVTMEGREWNLNMVTRTDVEHQFVRFSYNDTDIQLDYHPAFAESMSEILYMDVEGNSHDTKLSEFQLRNDMSGSFLVTAQGNEWDLDGDNKVDSYIICAKTDTNETQGWSNYSRQFAREDIPIELVMSDNTEITILKDGVPYEGIAHLTSTRGTDKQMEIVNGKIPFVDVRDLRSGIVVTCKDEARYLIGSYICEEHTLFTKQHLIASIPFFILIGCVLIGIVLVSIIRFMKRKS